MIKNGKIVKQISNQYTVISNDKTYICSARGKFRNESLTPLVGEIVEFDDEKKCILKLLPRKNMLSRPSVANIDAALVVTSLKEPNLSLNLLDRQLSVISLENIKPIILLTKYDLLNSDEKKEMDDIFKYYKSIGYDVYKNTEISKIKKSLKGKVVLLTGQTGAGKSSFLNKLDKDLKLETNPISKALGRGVHTTRHTEIYETDGIYFIDTPGFSNLDINCELNVLKDAFKEFDVECKFKDCMHDKEVGCTVKTLVEKGTIRKSRYNNYIIFKNEISTRKKKR